MVIIVPSTEKIRNPKNYAASTRQLPAAAGGDLAAELRRTPPTLLAVAALWAASWAGVTGCYMSPKRHGAATLGVLI